MRHLCFLFYLACFSLFAEQTTFSRQETNSTYTFNYKWADYFGATRQITFDLDRKTLNTQFRHNKAYRPEMAQRHVYIALKRQAKGVNPKEARISLQQISDEIRIHVRSDSQVSQQAWLRKLQQTQESAFDNYLYENHYARYVSPTGQEAIKIDHARFAAENIRVVLPAAQAIYEQLEEKSSTRSYVNLLLSWIQSIPYNTLEDRLVSNGSGFAPPSDVIANNLGDCDSKTVLAAALMRSLLPNLSMVIIITPTHALLGANLPRREDEATVEIEDLEYLLLEPTGPTIMPAGVIGEVSRYGIESGLYTHEKVPWMSTLNEYPE